PGTRFSITIQCVEVDTECSSITRYHTMPDSTPANDPLMDIHGSDTNEGFGEPVVEGTDDWNQLRREYVETLEQDELATQNLNDFIDEYAWVESDALEMEQKLASSQKALDDLISENKRAETAAKEVRPDYEKLQSRLEKQVRNTLARKDKADKAVSDCQQMKDDLTITKEEIMSLRNEIEAAQKELPLLSSRTEAIEKRKNDIWMELKAKEELYSMLVAVGESCCCSDERDLSAHLQKISSSASKLSD
ncbi:hypothetical protein PRIPAC_88625, partial [Pristionchus pacificus]